MKRARILFNGELTAVTVNDNNDAVLNDGTVIAEAEANWQPPCDGKIFVLGLNYADHAAELAFKAPEEPLVFLKGPNTLLGHRKNTYRPDGVDYMHYECELVAIIGKTAKNVSREEAMDYIGGYTVGNDYAIRDYLENYYRPNLRVKSRDTCTPVGPYIVDAKDVADPHNLALKTYINGELKQSGNTSDLVFDIPYLVEYLSAIMTLEPGDMIFTGTPEGLADVKPGDEIVTEVEGVGRLVNTIISETDYLASLN
ncbi:5-carboxy-2-oxohept-3-enedioate decarboxylase HpaG2 subunit [Oceanospirillum multiglobuliferum]|uniref:2-hydroxyhepta-2,4-diene-1,7-dioate isomerase n=1 Tax=Oceanospirillum multiglobuliferum TaxID=64969 RepID=A0A1T4QLZ7_9GAMM|nr:fumarylacetoacetate hydrolase family protein [Oceanospirillum multiglobuliferum]OPX56436.1 2-hydroxyhepta-2,4-diene-1,7-dioate isomerase [Oceanospirillum multiglobuliferum]SKA04725.1 5-carboxy-2-oxohept-3-enedioate decarboxylase HpaG2 subunit [Oceanospirillum multiglobuliferum]